MTISWIFAASLPLLLTISSATNMLLAECCRVELSVQSLGTTPFKFQVLAPGLRMESEVIEFNEPGGMRKLKIEGDNCPARHWHFVTWKQEKASASEDKTVNWVLAKEEKAKIDGHGSLLVEVGDNLIPRITDRLGVACAESLIC